MSKNKALLAGAAVGLLASALVKFVNDKKNMDAARATMARRRKDLDNAAATVVEVVEETVNNVADAARDTVDSAKKEAIRGASQIGRKVSKAGTTAAGAVEDGVKQAQVALDDLTRDAKSETEKAFAHFTPRKTFYSVRLDSAGPNKILLIKTLREALSIDLAEAKLMADDTPSFVLKKTDRQTAWNLVNRLNLAGGRVTVE